MTTPDHYNHTCEPGWCGTCTERKQRYGIEPNHPGGDVEPPRGTVSKPPVPECPHLGERVPGPRIRRVCTLGMAPGPVVCCSLLNPGEWKLGKECGPTCSGYPKVESVATMAAPIATMNLNPTRPRVVVTLGVGVKGGELLAITAPMMEAYAARCDADFLVIDGPAANPSYPLADKFRLRGLTEHWERCIFFDADIAIHPTAPNLFDDVPPGHVGQYDDFPELTSKEWLTTTLNTVCQSQGVETIPGLDQHCLNSGVVVWDRDTTGVWDAPAKPLPSGIHCAEQHWVQRNAMGLPRFRLSRRWNYQWWSDRSLSELLNIDPHVLHLSGMNQDDLKAFGLPTPEATRRMMLAVARWAAGPSPERINQALRIDMIDPNPVFVAVLYYHDWPAQMLKSFREHFPTEPLLLVNHLPDGDMRPEYHDKYTTIIDNPRGWNAGGHGGGMDAAADYLRAKRVKYMVHIEPDCKFSSREWYDSMIEAMESGAVMAGPLQFPYGPIHPCPSIWRVDDIPASFKPAPKVHQPNSKAHDSVALVRWLTEIQAPPEMIHAHVAQFDTGLYASYLASVLGKAVVTSVVGITHHWNGRGTSLPTAWN